MALPSPYNPISLGQIQIEFGGSNPIAITEYYRNGAYTSGNNANVPTSGQISFSNFYNASAGYVVTISATATNVNARTLFEAAYPGSWAQNAPKKLVINSGVIVGATNTLNYALVIPSGFGSNVTIDNFGSIQGAGGFGAINSGQSGGIGGNAIIANASGVIINNQGTIYAGGGGGGRGGQGASITGPITSRFTGTNTQIYLGYYSNLTITVAGANGGNGGNDGPYLGGSGGRGFSGTFTVNNTSGYIAIFAGTKGSDGASDVTSSTPGGAKGTSGINLNGGTGGKAGPTATAGAGGGGGSATVVTFSTSTSSFGSPYIIAGGAGGGGGGSNGAYTAGIQPPSSNAISYTNWTATASIGQVLGTDGAQGGTTDPNYNSPIINQFNTTGLRGGGGGGGGSGSNTAGSSSRGGSSGYRAGAFTSQTGLVIQSSGAVAGGGNGGASRYNSIQFTKIGSFGYNDNGAGGDGYVIFDYTGSTSGGSGGYGGRGIGYNQSQTNAPTSGQSNGPVNGTSGSGNGSVGGNGGGWGESGGNGTIGGNNSSGSSANGFGVIDYRGSGPGYGGLAGFYITNNSNVTWTNTGTVAGRVG
jgi:hypothetical protein